MGKKDKSKKPNPKKDRYAQFRKDKPKLNLASPELNPEQTKWKQNAEQDIGKFFKFNFRRSKKKKR